MSRILGWEAFVKRSRYDDRPVYGLRGTLGCSFCFSQMTFEGEVELSPWVLKDGPNNVEWLVGHVEHQRWCPSCGIIQVVPERQRQTLLVQARLLFNKKALSEALAQMNPTTSQVVDRGPIPADDDFMRAAFHVDFTSEISLGKSGLHNVGAVEVHAHDKPGEGRHPIEGQT